MQWLEAALQKATSPYGTAVPPEVTVARSVIGEPEETDWEEKERTVIVGLVAASNPGELMPKGTRARRHRVTPVVIQFEFGTTEVSGKQIGENFISDLRDVEKNERNS
jgi:hypothetical protein